MASIRTYHTTGGERRYEVRWREAGRSRSKSHVRLADARREKTEVERRLQLGVHYQARPGSFGDAEREWYGRYQVGLESKGRPRW